MIDGIASEFTHQLSKLVHGAESHLEDACWKYARDFKGISDPFKLGKQTKDTVLGDLGDVVKFCRKKATSKASVKDKVEAKCRRFIDLCKGEAEKVTKRLQNEINDLLD